MILTDRIDPAALLLPWHGATPPLGVIELGSAPPAAPLFDPPPFPLIGVGDPAHPWAPAMDAVIEAPLMLGGVRAQVGRAPIAALVAVQLLRTIAFLPMHEALVAESLAYGVLQGGGEHRAWRATRGAVAASPSGRLRADRDGDRLLLEIDRPAARNAIDVPLRDALHEMFELAVLDQDIAAVELSGLGRAFCVGAELSEFGTTRDPAVAHAIRMQTLPAFAVARVADRLTVRVRGACVGAGLELAAFARRIEATRDAWFQLPELAMGLIPGAGGCVSLSRRIGRQRTALLILSGRRIDAVTALRWGLIDALVDE